MLLAELRRREPGEEQRVHRRAAGWYDPRKQPERAVYHALAGQDRETAVRLVTTYAPLLADDGRGHVVHGWLEALDGGALEDHPLLATRAGWIWAAAGNTALAHRCLLAAEAGARAAGPAETGTRLTAGTVELRAVLAPLGVERMVPDAQRALALQSVVGPGRARPAALLGVAQLLNGATAAGAATLERAALIGRHGQHRTACFAYAQLSLLAADRADWRAAADHAAWSRALLDRAAVAERPGSIPTHVASARVALHSGDTATARHSVDQALRLYDRASLTSFPWLGAQMAIVLGHILLDLGDDSAARRKTVDARRFLARLPTQGVLRDQYERLAADLDHHRDRPASHPTTLTTAELRILHLLPTHLTLGEIADELYLSRNTVKSHVAAVYRKLHASTRTQAVSEGRTLGLLES
jgi:LuxR family maltose regulon positive regulatory protein